MWSNEFTLQTSHLDWIIVWYIILDSSTVQIKGNFLIQTHCWFSWYIIYSKSIVCTVEISKIKLTKKKSKEKKRKIRYSQVCIDLTEFQKTWQHFVGGETDRTSCGESHFQFSNFFCLAWFEFVDLIYCRYHKWCSNSISSFASVLFSLHTIH